MTAYWLAQGRRLLYRLSDWYHNVAIVANVASTLCWLSVYGAVDDIYFFWAPIPLVPVPSHAIYVH